VRKSWGGTVDCVAVYDTGAEGRDGFFSEDVLCEDVACEVLV
jgi:hypothetical protein